MRVGGDDLAEGAEEEDLRTLAGEGVTFLLAANPRGTTVTAVVGGLWGRAGEGDVCVAPGFVYCPR